MGQREKKAREKKRKEEEKRKLTQVQDGYRAASAGPGATVGIASAVVPCEKVQAALTVRLVSTNPGIRQVIAGTVMFTMDGTSVTKNTNAAAAYLPLKTGAKFTVTGTVTNPGPGGFTTASVTRIVTVADLEHKFCDLQFTPVPALSMYLDGDRDGAVDAVPAQNPAWVWGPAGPQVGGIIAVANRWDSYLPAANVLERAEVVFRWDGGVVAPAGWTATLACIHPQMRLFDGRAKNAVQLVLPLDFTTPQLVALRQPADNSVHLWMQAANYPATATENDWRVTLTFTFTPAAGAAVVQTAVLRIAPWIMASDLDQTARVYSVAPAAPVGLVPTPSIGAEISNVVGPVAAFTGVQLGMGGAGAKPFFRDVMKAGMTDCPHYEGLVILTDLDPGASQPLKNIRNTETALGAGSRRVWENLPTANAYAPPAFNFLGAAPPMGAEPSSQDHGGNLLVSPPVLNYPLGRILFGQGTGAFNWKVCNVRGFFDAQRVQGPLELDSGWLNVGHIDEFVSFVPDPGDGNWPYKILLASPRLGYALAHAASAQQNTVGVNVPGLIAHAAALSELARLAHDNFLAFEARLNADAAIGPIVAAAALAVNPPVGPGAYVANPACPPGLNGRIVKWRDGNSIVAQCIQNYFARVEDGVPGRFHLFSYNFVQPVIDATRQILKQGLRRQAGVDLEDRFFIEVPVLLALSGGAWVTDTPDSVNLLLLNQPGGRHCLIPKPFGPVLAQHYLFEDYIQSQLAPLGLTLQFLNDQVAFHAHEGEIHCGSNQIPTLPLFPARPHWWQQAPA